MKEFTIKVNGNHIIVGEYFLKQTIDGFTLINRQGNSCGSSSTLEGAIQKAKLLCEEL